MNVCKGLASPLDDRVGAHDSHLRDLASLAWHPGPTTDIEASVPSGERSRSNAFSPDGKTYSDFHSS